MATNAALRNQALERLGRVNEGDVPDAPDAERMDDIITQEFAWLETKGLNYWATDEIPDFAMNPLAEYIAGISAKNFMEPQTAQAYEIDRGLAFRRLVSALAVEKGDDAVRAEYY